MEERDALISLKRAIRTDRIESLERSFQTAVDCYSGTIQAVAEHAVPVSEDLVHDLQEALGPLRRTLESSPSVEAMASGEATFRRSLKDFADRSKAALAQKDGDIREILGLVANAAITLGTGAEDHHEHVLSFIHKLESISRLRSLPEIRSELSGQLHSMRSYGDSIQKQTQDSIEKLRMELNEFRSRLSATEVLASTDALTAVFNRREGERVLEQAIGLKKQFCIILFDLDRFKAVNDRWGHQWGDQVLKTFAARLRAKVRVRDVVCRWGGDEFLVIMECGLTQAASKANQLASECGGDYHIVFSGQAERIQVRSSVGVAEYEPGEGDHSFFARADALLYRDKKGSKPEPANKTRNTAGLSIVSGT